MRAWLRPRRWWIAVAVAGGVGFGVRAAAIAWAGVGSGVRALGDGWYLLFEGQ